MRNKLIKLLGGKPKAKTMHVWEYEPYAFEPGRKYVIEIDRFGIDMEEIRALHDWFDHQGIIVKLVLTRGGEALHPMSVKRMTEESSP